MTRSRKNGFLADLLIDRVAPVFFVVLIAGLCWGLISALCYREDPVEAARIFAAWKTANPSYSYLSQEEWTVLRRHEMLPNVDYAAIRARRAQESSEQAQAMSATAIGISSGK